MVCHGCRGCFQISASRESNQRVGECVDLLRCITDANVGGAEKLCVSSMPEDLGIRPPFAIKVDELSPESTGLLPPLSAFMIKGWSRAVCAHTIMLCGYECEEFFNEWPKHLRECLVTIPFQIMELMPCYFFRVGLY